MIPVTKVIFLLNGILAAGYSVAFLFANNWEIGDDAARLMGTARGIEEGKLTFNNRPATKFPPLVPLLLAVLNRFIDEFVAAALLHIAGASVAILFSTMLILKVVGSRIALVSLFLLGLSPFFVRTVTGSLNTDIVYLALSSLVLFLTCSAQIRTTTFISIMVLSILCPMTRTVGVAIPITLFLVGLTQLFGQRRLDGFKLIISGFSGMAATASWLWWGMLNRVVQSPDEYFDSYLVQFWLRESNHPDAGFATIPELFLRFYDQAVTQMAALGGLFLRDAWISPIWFHPLIVLLSVLIASGILALLKSRYKVLPVYFCLYCAIIFLWPFKESFRFMLPVFPLSMVLVAKGYLFLKERVRLKYLRWSVLILFVGGAVSHQTGFSRGNQSLLSVAIWLLLFVVLSRIKFPRISVREPAYTVAAALILFGLVNILGLLPAKMQVDQASVRHSPVYLASQWIRENTAREDPIILQEDSIAHFLTDRPTLRWPVTEDQSITLKKASEHNAKYLIATDDQQYPYFVPTQGCRLEKLRSQFGTQLKPVFTGTGFAVFQFVGS